MREEARPETSRTHPRESSFVSLLSGWAQQGVQSYFATQRILLDLAMRQNASVMHVLRERLTDPRHSPATVLTEMVGEGMTNLMEAQQVLLGLAQRQNEIVMTGVKERVGGYAAAEAMTDLLRRNVDTVIEMQQEFLKIADKQTHTLIEGGKTGKVFKGEALVALARQAMENFVRAEKKFLDVIAEETAKATGSKHGNGAGKKLKKTELTELARHATESFIDAQKKLFDVAGRQMNVNLKTASRTMDVLGPLPIVPFTDLTREGVKSFVDAQKALMDAMTKPHNGPKHAAKAHRGKKPARATHAAA
ncbi:MAG: hypothetical protein LAO03_07395 [Acidobacteriia bacterium]|nr:hypothetical protein [Terriglobia bacterium]